MHSKLLIALLALTPSAAIHAAEPLGVSPTETSAPAPDNVLTGEVIDSKTGETLPGVTIAFWQKGKLAGGTSTDINGKFTLKNAPKGDFEIRISYIGYTQQSIASSKMKAGMKIRLAEDEKMLKEVVKVGFLDKSKNSFTGAVTQISGADLKMVTGTNMISAIAALTPGMEMVINSDQGSNPNHVPELVMRGMSSFSNEGQEVNQPTIILDNTEISMQELYDLDMNEVESINVLKDASATALYGAKASNGVIVITRKPIAESTIHVAYNFTGNVQFPMLGDYQLLDPMQKLEYERLAGLYNAKGATDPTSGLPLQYKYDELYNQRYKAIMAGQNSDWLAQPARTAFSHDHSLRIYGGASKIRYELTGRFGNTHGVMKEDYRRRYNLGYKLSYFATNSIQISNRSNYSEVLNKETPYGSFYQYTQMNPYDRMYGDDGRPNTDLAWDLDNPLYEATLGNYTRGGTRTFTNNTDVRWDISRKFRLTGHFNVTSSMGWNDEYTSPLSRRFKKEDDLTKKGSLYQGHNRGIGYSGNVVGTFNHLFKDESLISTSLGWEINHSKDRSEYLTTIGYFNDQLSFVGNAAGYPTTSTPHGLQEETSDVGVFLTANYSFRNRYFVDGTWRMTGSSQFGSNNRWGHFWSVGAGWNIMNEAFMAKAKHLFDVFKLRGSMGFTGKVSFEPFQAMTMYQYLNTYEYKNGIGAVPRTIGNIDLAWERTMNYDLGIDFSMFDRRLNFVIDGYIRNTTDLLLNRDYAPSTGITSAMCNLGELRNTGLEFQIDGYIFRNRNFHWKIGTTGYFNSNKITKINEALKRRNQQNQELENSFLNPLPQYAEGESLTALKLVKSAGIDPATGREVYIKRNGELTFEYDANDKVLIGDTQPKYNGTFNTSVYWKGITVYALFNFRLGGMIYNTTRVTKVEGSDPKHNADKRVFDLRWKQPGDIAYYKDIADSSRPHQTDRFAETENTLTLGTLNISYEFNDQICKKLHLTNLRAGINFTDILRLSSVKIERGTNYLYSQGFELNVSATF